MNNRLVIWSKKDKHQLNEEETAQEVKQNHIYYLCKNTILYREIFTQFEYIYKLVANLFFSSQKKKVLSEQLPTNFKDSWMTRISCSHFNLDSGLILPHGISKEPIQRMLCWKAGFLWKSATSMAYTSTCQAEM